MMTIDELLATARRYAELASSSSAGDRAMFAQIAQACAQTAQAMILARMAFDGVDGKLALYVVTP